MLLKLRLNTPSAILEIQRSKSWWERYQESKKGPGLSDEDYVKFFGMTREEFIEKMKDKPGVGGKQKAGVASHHAWAGGGGGDG